MTNSRRSGARSWLLALSLVGGCGGGETPANTEGQPDLAMPPAPPAWSRGLDQTSKLYSARRGLKDVRGIIHLHSVYSHDACDGKPLPSGAPAQPCFQDLRDGLCATHEDYVMLTDHNTSFSDHDWDPLFLPMQGDEAVMAGGKHVASWLACPDGHKILLQIGSENEVMPIGLESHVADDVDTRHTLMGGDDATSIQAFRDHGGLVAFAHTESHSLDQLRRVKPDSVEIYNIHANLDPRIREAMGMDPTGAIAKLGPFLQSRDDGPTPDLAFLAFGEDLPAEQTKYNQLLSEGWHLTATAGTDAHQNVFTAAMSDGERGDSYRRMLRFFSNHYLIDELTPAKIKDAIKAGRGYVLFEVFGPAKGFDARAELSGGRTAELGSDVMLADQPAIVVDPPTVDLAPGMQAPGLKIRVILADKPEGTVVAEGDGAAPLRFTPSKAGAYRIEIRVLPNHLIGYMGTQQKLLLHEMAWILTNPFYVK